MKQKGFTLIELIIVIIVLFGAGGWIANIVKLVHMINDPVTNMFIARAVGVVLFPFGMILGYF